MTNDENRPYPPGIAFDEAWRQLQRANAAEAQRDALRLRAEIAEDDRDRWRASCLELADLELDDRNQQQQRADAAEAQRDALKAACQAFIAADNQCGISLAFVMATEAIAGVVKDSADFD